MIIDNDTGRILDEAVAKLPTITGRTAVYAATMAAMLDPRNAPQPGGPWCEMSIEERSAAMHEARDGGAHARACELMEQGYAIGHFGG